MRLEIYVILREPEVKHILEKKKKKKKAKLLSYANYPYPSFPSAPLLSQKLKTCFLERKVIKLLCSITNII